jgi:hypothetical protein
MRKPVIMAFLHSTCLPVMTLHNYFSVNREEGLSQLQMNGQVCRLRHFLNRKFPEAENRISITDGIQQGVWQYAWDESLVFHHYLLIERTLFWDRATIIQGTSGFTVEVPYPLNAANSRDKIAYYLNTYKLLSKTYTIRYFKTIN